MRKLYKTKLQGITNVEYVDAENNQTIKKSNNKYKYRNDFFHGATVATMAQR